MANVSLYFSKAISSDIKSFEFGCWRRKAFAVLIFCRWQATPPFRTLIKENSIIVKRKFSMEID
jgi:hypothetical protein